MNVTNDTSLSSIDSIVVINRITTITFICIRLVIITASDVIAITVVTGKRIRAIVYEIRGTSNACTRYTLWGERVCLRFMML